MFARYEIRRVLSQQQLRSGSEATPDFGEADQKPKLELGSFPTWLHNSIRGVSIDREGKPFAVRGLPNHI